MGDAGGAVDGRSARSLFRFRVVFLPRAGSPYEFPARFGPRPAEEPSAAELQAGCARGLLAELLNGLPPSEVPVGREPRLEVWGLTEVPDSWEDEEGQIFYGWQRGPADWVGSFGPLPLGDSDALDEWVGAFWPEMAALGLDEGDDIPF